MAFFAFPMFDPMSLGDRSTRQMRQNMEYHAQAHAGFYRPWRHIPGQQSENSNVSLDKKRFQVELDVQHYTPEEICVKTTDNQIVVTAKHEEKEDEHGFVSRHFVRRYAIPKGVQAEFITSTFSSDGHLTITAPMVSAAQGPNERTIPISIT